MRIQVPQKKLIGRTVEPQNGSTFNKNDLEKKTRWRPFIRPAQSYHSKHTPNHHALLSIEEMPAHCVTDMLGDINMYICNSNNRYSVLQKEFNELHCKQLNCSECDHDRIK